MKTMTMYPTMTLNTTAPDTTMMNRKAPDITDTMTMDTRTPDTATNTMTDVTTDMTTTMNTTDYTVLMMMAWTALMIRNTMTTDTPHTTTTATNNNILINYIQVFIPS